MNYRVISTGSKGNCVIYKDLIMVDIGIKLKDRELIIPYLDSIKLIVITHRHSDHLQLPLLKWIIENYPNIRIVYGTDVEDYLSYKLVKKLKGETVPILLPKFTIVNSEKAYDFGLFKIRFLDLYHDVPNFGLYIQFKDDYKVFHATDTYTLEGISIPQDTDLIAIEHHHIEEHYKNLIEEKQMNGEYSHEYGAKNAHHSFEQCKYFLDRNNLNNVEVLRLHISSDEYYKDFELSYIYERENEND